MNSDNLDDVGAGEVSERRVLDLRSAELVFGRERDPSHVFHPLDMLGAESGFLELPAVEGRPLVAASELLGKAFLFEPTRPRGRHRLEAFVEIPRPSRHAGLA